MTMIIDGTNGLTFNNSTTQASAGVVLQVVNATYSTYAQTASSTYSDTGLTATITPKFSTSKVLVLVSISGAGKTNASATNSLDLQLVRNSTAILQIEGFTGFNNTAQFSSGSASASYLDSPATTSSTVYKVQFASDQNTANAYINNTNARTSTSTITLLEIAA